MAHGRRQVAGGTIGGRVAAELRSGNRLPVAALLAAALAVTGVGLSTTYAQAASSADAGTSVAVP